jgi:hypothetical protein
MNNNLLRVAAFTILLTRVKIKRSKQAGEQEASTSGKRMVDYFAKHQKSKPEDWEFVEKVVEKARWDSMRYPNCLYEVPTI